jgi:hypothetical protein
MVTLEYECLKIVSNYEYDVYLVYPLGYLARELVNGVYTVCI